MPKFFMTSTEHQELEQLMMLVPNFLPRRSGVIVVQKMKAAPSGVEKSRDCVSGHCKLNSAGRVSEQIGSGELCYEALINKCFEKIKTHHLNKRLGELIRSYKGGFFLNLRHLSRFHSVCQIQNEPVENRKPADLATLFLLTADDRLWCAARDCVYLNDFEFGKMRLNGINTDGYALYQMARTIQLARECIKLDEIADKQLIGNQAFKGIIHSILIARLGAAMLQVKS